MKSLVLTQRPQLGYLNEMHICVLETLCIKAEIMDVTAWGRVPVQVITTSICRMTSLSLTTRNPSMLCGYTDRYFYLIQQQKHVKVNLKQMIIIYCSFGITANLLHDAETKVQQGEYTQ